jgi:hypothetical protein
MITLQSKVAMPDPSLSDADIRNGTRIGSSRTQLSSLENY